MLIKYSGKNKFIFVANTKCASTSIHSSRIAEISDIKLTYSWIYRHISLEDIYDKFNFIFEKVQFNEFFKFGVIRDPLDWVVSWFNFNSRPELRGSIHQAHHEHYTGEMTFSEFWHLHKNDFLLKPQSNRFFSNKNEKIRIDYLVRLEKLIEDLSTIREILGLDSLEIPKINESLVRRIGPNDVEDSIKEEIREKYSNDYELLANLKLLNSRGLELFKDRMNSR